MQQDLEASHPQLRIQIHTVNQTGLEQSTSALTQGGAPLPLLQDTLSDNAWDAWLVNLRDFFILDADGHLVSITQLSPPDEGGGGIVGNAEAAQALQAALIAAAEGS